MTTLGRDDFARAFVLQRQVDVTGVSGTGIVASGVLFPDGKAVLRWNGEWATTVTHDRGMDSIKAIHSHDGKTQIVFLDEYFGADRTNVARPRGAEAPEGRA